MSGSSLNCLRLLRLTKFIKPGIFTTVRPNDHQAFLAFCRHSSTKPYFSLNDDLFGFTTEQKQVGIIFYKNS